MLNTMYVLIVVANSHPGVTVSQQDYLSKDRCEIAAIVVEQMVKDVKGVPPKSFQIRCVQK